MHSSTRSSPRPQFAAPQFSIAGAIQHTFDVLSSMTQRSAQRELLDIAARLKRTNPEAAARMQKAALDTWE